VGILQKKAVALGFITGCVGLVIAWLPFGLAFEERVGLAWFFNLRGERLPPKEAIVISVDKESIDQLHLPDNILKWPRATHAQLVSKLTDQKAAVIAFDISFKEPSEEDALFAKAIGVAKNVVLVEQIEWEKLPLSDQSDAGIEIQRLIPPVPLLAQAAAALATFPIPKIPLQVSQYWQFKDSDLNLPTLPVAAFQIFSPTLYQKRFNVIQGRDADSAYLNFYGPPRTITTVPYYKVLQLPHPVFINGKAVSFQGKAVFVGLSELAPTRQKDGFHTVFSQSDGLDLSGVEIGATAFSNLVDNREIKPLPFWAWLLTLLLWGIFIGATCLLLSPSVAMPFCIGVSLIYFWITFLAFKLQDTWFPLMIPILFQTPFAFLGSIFSHYFQARKMERLKSEAVLHLSHEIRSPLASTKGYLDNLRDGIVGDLTEGQERYITRMLSNMERLNRMVQDQLNLSQIESGNLTVSLVPLSLKDLLSERIETFRPIFSRKNIQVSLSAFEETAVISGDRDRMDQIFTNLLDNAIKFTPSGGSITVTCRKNGKWIETCVQDTGIGIPDREQSKIFNRLHQVRTGQPKQGKGAGLGLFIVKQLVELQGGTIRVQSLPAPAQGSEFIVAFPVY
jgi:signal transduction histidine kinase